MRTTSAIDAVGNGYSVRDSFVSRLGFLQDFSVRAQNAMYTVPQATRNWFEVRSFLDWFFFYKILQRMHSTPAIRCRRQRRPSSSIRIIFLIIITY